MERLKPIPLSYDVWEQYDLAADQRRCYLLELDRSLEDKERRIKLKRSL